jgi:uncharacterized DUF497 family protein
LAAGGYLRTRFDWDGNNTLHLARHRITTDEAEECFRNDPVITEHDAANGEDRWKAVSATAALRILVLIFTVREEQIRVITGWDADKMTKKTYFKEKGF